MVYGVNKGTCKQEEGLAILSLILTRCDTLGIVLLVFWAPREFNRVSDYLSHLSVLVRSDVTGVFTADSAEALATAAAGVLDDSVLSALARATGVDADGVEQVMQSAGSRCRPEEFNSQDLHCSSISQRLCSRKSSPVPPDRDVHIHVLCPTRHAQRGQLPEPRDIFDSSAAGMCPPGPTLALPRRTDTYGQSRQSAPAGRPPPPTTEAPPPGTSPATVHCSSGPPEPTPTTDLAPVIHSSRRSSPHRGGNLGSSDNGRTLGPGPHSPLSPVHPLEDLPHGT